MTTRKLKALKTKAIKALVRMEKYGEKIGDNEISWELDRLESEARKAVGLYASEANDHCLSMFVSSSPTGIWSLRESAWVHVFYKPETTTMEIKEAQCLIPFGGNPDSNPDVLISGEGLQVRDVQAMYSWANPYVYIKGVCLNGVTMKEERTDKGWLLAIYATVEQWNAVKSEVARLAQTPGVKLDVEYIFE